MRGVDDEPRSDLQSLLLFIVTTAEQVARAVLTNSPFVRCFPCLSAQVGMLEKDVREVAQLLIVHDEFFVDRRVCQAAATPTRCSSAARPRRAMTARAFGR
jgi:hypothetical protein